MKGEPAVPSPRPRFHYHLVLESNACFTIILRLENATTPRRAALKDRKPGVHSRRLRGPRLGIAY